LPVLKTDERDVGHLEQPIRSPAAKIALALLGVAGLLIALSLATRYGAYRAEVARPGSAQVAAWKAIMRLFDVNSEKNVPSWFSSMLLMGCALVSALLAALGRRGGGRDAGYWAALAAVFSLLSLDEAAALHERLGGPVAEVLGAGTRGALHFAWVVPGVILALVVGLAFLRFVVGLPPSTRRLVVGAAALYLTGAVALEAVGGMVLEAQGHRAMYLLVTAAEEGLEMAGSVLFLYAVLRRLRLRPESGGGYRLSTVDPESVHSEAPELVRAAADHRLPSGPSSGR
jgi:cytochrome bd-type quinol oxidase subunit 2